MFRIYHFASMISHATIRRNSVRFISLLKIKDTVKNLLNMESVRLPYKHVCQVGDPVLRGRAMFIEPDIIKTAEFQKVINHLISVMRSYGACGLSGPQIGLPWQIFVIEYTKEDLKLFSEAVNKIYETKIIPMTVFINPELKVIDHTPITFYEGCESIRGFSAAVSRSYEVEITAFNASAEKFTWKECGWPARIAQHEYDHLQGKLYIDKMDVSTFHCTCWEKINKNNGELQLSYWPKNKTRDA